MSCAWSKRRARWVETGYNPAEVVEEPGTFARRGGIVDIWPPNLPHPVRIDLFGDDVESLRLFDPATQRTLRKVSSVEIGPGSEALAKYGPNALSRLALDPEQVAAGNVFDAATGDSPLQDPHLLLAVREEIRNEVEHMAQGHAFHGIEWYLPYFFEQPASLLDFLPADATLVLDDGLDFFATVYELETQAAGLHAELQRTGELPHDFAPNFFATDELRNGSSRPTRSCWAMATSMARAPTPIHRWRGTLCPARGMAARPSRSSPTWANCSKTTPRSCCSRVKPPGCKGCCKTPTSSPMCRANCPRRPCRAPS